MRLGSDCVLSAGLGVIHTKSRGGRSSFSFLATGASGNGCATRSDETT